MPCLSRNDIEQIAAHVIDQYKRNCLPEKRLCYAVDPLELTQMLGLKVVFRHLSDDGTVLGMTSPDEVCVTIFDDSMEEMMFYLDGSTILIEKNLNQHPSAVGRRNFTIAHECAHQLIYRMFPDVYGTSCRLFCDYRRNAKPKKQIEDWEEWQADAMAASLLLPVDAIKDAMFICGLGEKMKVLSRKYSENNYIRFCDMANLLGASRSALSFRMEQLDLLERNELIAEARVRRGVA